MAVIKGHEIAAVTIKDSYDRRAVQFKNNIITALNRIGVNADDIDVELAPVAYKSAPASATWYYDGHRFFYDYKMARKYVDNLYIVCKVIELTVQDLLAEKITMQEFISSFSEDHDLDEQRIEARATLGLEADVMDADVIDKKYKELAKSLHPDMPGGDAERFKQINKAHKILKRELS